jgi:hypothetical protein
MGNPVSLCQKGVGMNMMTFLRVLCFAIASTVPVAAWGNPVPQSLVDTLQHREQHFSSSTFNWQFTDEELHHPLLTPEKIRAARIAGEKGWEEQFRKAGAKDENEIKRAAIDNTNQELAILRGGSLKYSNGWRFERSGVSTLVTGTTESLGGLASTQQQFYEADLALSVPLFSRLADGTKVSDTDPSVWRTAGDSIRYPNPLTWSLGLAPEHFAMLIGLNPLTLYGVNWQLLSTTANAWVIGTHLTADGFPATFQITLDRLHGGAPSDIKITKSRQSQEFHAEGFQLHEGVWFPHRVHIVSHAAEMLDTDQSWTLQSVLPSQPLQVTLKLPNPVHDYRLLGVGLSQKTIQSAEMGKHHDIVYYQWEGQFPSANDIEKLHQRQHPGEATPDPKSSASLPFVGGLLCLVGGVWMFKRRGVS